MASSAAGSEGYLGGGDGGGDDGGGEGGVQQVPRILVAPRKVRYQEGFLDPDLPVDWSRRPAAASPCRDMLEGWGCSPAHGLSGMHRTPCRFGLGSNIGPQHSWQAGDVGNIRFSAGSSLRKLLP